MTEECPIGDKLDRHARGDLSPAEVRELAQASLDSPELFDDLTDLALAKAALTSGTLPAEKLIWFPRNAWFVIAAVAAVVLISLAIVRPGSTGKPHLKPVLTLLAAHNQPVLLASGLQPTQTDNPAAPVFRSQQTDSRAPRIAGSVLSVEDGTAAINLGSLDGLDKGSEVLIFRDDQSTEVIGRLQVTAVFREHARGRRFDAKQVPVNAQVRVDGPTHLNALWDQVDALYNRGDANAAYNLAEQASAWAEAAHVPPVHQAALWNQLAVLRMLRADYPGAEALLLRAAAASPKTDLTYARSVNNLGVWAELRGDSRQAQSQYADAVRVLAGIPDAPDQERRAVDANLARLRGPH